MEEKSRETNLDLMRLVCMLMVLSLHYFGEGVITAGTVSLINGAFASIMVVLCREAVNCYYMNSGFF